MHQFWIRFQCGNKCKFACQVFQSDEILDLFPFKDFRFSPISPWAGHRSDTDGIFQGLEGFSRMELGLEAGSCRTH